MDPGAVTAIVAVIVMAAVVVVFFFLWASRDTKKKEKKKAEEPLWDTSGPSRWVYFGEMPFYLKIFIVVAVILGFNIALFLPLGMTAVAFEVWLGLLQLVKLQLPLWLYLLVLIPVVLSGIYLVPRIEIPDAGADGVKAIYLSKRTDGNREKFRTLSQHGTIVVNRAWVRHVGFFRYVVVGKVKLLQYDEKQQQTTVQSEQLEVERDEALQEENRILKKEIKQMRRDHAKGGAYVTRDHLEEMLNRSRRE